MLPLAEFVGYRAVNLRYIFGILRNRQRGLPFSVRFLCSQLSHIFLRGVKSAPVESADAVETVRVAGYLVRELAAGERHQVAVIAQNRYALAADVSEGIRKDRWRIA